MARHHVILQVSYFKDLAVLRRQKRERKSRNRSHAAHPGRLFLNAGDLSTSLWLCPFGRTFDPSTFLAIAQEQRNSWQCLPAWERLGFHPSRLLSCWGFIHNKDMSKHDYKNCSKSSNVYTQQINTFCKKKKKLYDCTLQKIIISKIDVKMPYGKGSVDQQWQPVSIFTVVTVQALWHFADKLESMIT